MNLLFDLDGTLTDPELGITTCFQHALTALGRAEVPERAALRPYIGPPLREGLGRLLGSSDEALIESAVAAYRERYGTVGLFENAVYPDVPEGLRQLRDAGHRLWVATSKPHVYARQICAHYGIDSFFQEIYGSEMDGARSAKGELIAHIIGREGLSPTQTWMIGDRAHDIVGGRANGVRTAGVLWGYGSEQELRDTGADAVVATMAELCALLMEGR